MKTVQVVIEGTDEVIASITKYDDGKIRGIGRDGYDVYVDGEKLINEKATKEQE